MTDLRHVHRRPSSWTRSIIVALLVAVCVVPAAAAKYFNKEDEAALGHFSNALSAWYEVNQLGQPKGEADFGRVLALLNSVHTECSMVPDKTLAKIDAELAVQWRQNLQQGAKQYEAGLRAYIKAAKSGGNPSAADRALATEGQQKMVQFHMFYNANIERIVERLKAKGVDIFG